jgi:hypothetical protein
MWGSVVGRKQCSELGIELSSRFLSGPDDISSNKSTSFAFGVAAEIRDGYTSLCPRQT